VSHFLTVKEAARLTGKSPSSIRRVIYPIIRNDKHPDRKHIKPSSEEALILRTKGENFAWRLSEELLRREVPIEAATEKGTAAASRRGPPGDAGDLLAMLRSELDIKNKQIGQQGELIAKQMQLIDGLSERLREGNVMMHSLQQRLALPDGKRRAPIEAAPLEQTVTASPEQGSKPTSKHGKPRKSLLHRIFG
jgi:hypothetical protein